MDYRITTLLDSTDPQDRKKAIKLLAQMGGHEALRKLAEIYKYDGDPEIKDLAIQAGKFIKKQEMTLAAQPPEPSLPPLEAEPAALEEEMTSVIVSASNQERAKGLLDRALDMSMRGEHDKAVDGLVKAFKLNPNYRMDSYAMGIVMNVTGMDKADFFALLSDDKRIRSMKDSAKEKVQKEKAKSGGHQEATWDVVMIDLGMYYAIVSGAVIIVLIIAVQMTRTGLAALAQGCTTCSPTDLARIKLVLGNNQMWQTFTPAYSILGGLIGGTGMILYMLFYFGVLHLICQVMLGQGGSYRGILHRGSRIVMMSYGLGVLLSVIVILVSMHESLNPHYFEIYGQAGMMESTPIWKMMLGASVFLTFGGGLWLSFAVADYYEVDWVAARRAMFFTYMITSTALGFIITELSSRLAIITK